jgi:hypothetical protein
LGPGQRAPSLVVRDVHGVNQTLVPCERQPTVLAFLDGWSVRDEQDDAVQALLEELGPLGAALVALTPDALWYFRPHDETQAFVTSIELDPEAVQALRASYGLGRERDALGLFVIDCSNTIRFGHVAEAQDFLEPGEMLLAALSAAGRALLVPRPSSPLVLRRELVAACLVVGFALVLLEASEPAPPSVRPGPPSGFFARIDITLDVNGSTRTLRVHPDAWLLDALRDHVGISDTLTVCQHGDCGACAVLVGNRRAYACSTLAVDAKGAKVITLEGLARGAELQPQRAPHDADDAPRSVFPRWPRMDFSRARKSTSPSAGKAKRSSG